MDSSSTTRRLALFAVLVGGFVFGVPQLIKRGVIPRPNVLKNVIPVVGDDIKAQVLPTADGTKVTTQLPTSHTATVCVDGNTHSCLSGATLEIQQWAWNANAAMDLAVGAARSGNGIVTSRGSLAEAQGVSVSIQRQDDTNKMQDALLDSAQKLSSDPNATGTKFITIMGDQAAAFFKGINPKLAKVCADCTAEVIDTIGYSRGEDVFLGPAEWKSNPQSAKGGFVIGSLREGDWNIAIKWLGQNGIANNPDDTVYSPDALNWISADSYTEAANRFAAGTACVDLPTKGKFGGAKAHYCAQGVVTWTPGDVTVAKKRGGVVPILSTRVDAFQMPCVLIGLKRYDKAHRSEIVKLLTATHTAADQMKNNPDALVRASEVSYALYQEESPAYWLKYYKGVKELDAKGVMIELGGSSVANLADAMQSLGLSGPNLFAATYNRFGKLVVQNYPRLVPDFPPVDQVLDVSYLQTVASGGTLPTDNAEKVSYDGAKHMTSVEGKRNYSIQFRTGSAEILPESIPVLDEIVEDVVITKYAIAVTGHTDNTGTPDGNISLSEARALSVAAYLKRKGGFPDGRVRTSGHGQEEPVASNATTEGRALNRRVQIVLGAL